MTVGKERTIEEVSSITDIAEGNVFSQSALNEIFKCSSRYPDRLVSRENSWLEFKESFNLGSFQKYARTFAAFANTRGGFVVFGIGNNPRLLKGISEDSFDKIDAEQITKRLNEHFSPEIAWDMYVYEFGEKHFGMFFIRESGNKPVIAKKDSGDTIKEGEIYYRYRGRSEKIKYPELVTILNEHRQQEQSKWMRHLERISKIGVENAAVFDANTGTVEGFSGAFIIDEALLPKLKYIKEGSFNQTTGSPTLKVVGQVKPIQHGTLLPVKRIPVTKIKAIRTEDIVYGFLRQEQVDNPIEYINQICYEASAALPVYHYLKQSGKNNNEIIDLLKQNKSRSPAQDRLIKRLSTHEDFSISIPNSGSRAAFQKTSYRKLILEKAVDTKISGRDLKYLVQSFRTLSLPELDTAYTLELIKELFDVYFADRKTNLAGELRYTLCHLDILLNRTVISEGVS